MSNITSVSLCARVTMDMHNLNNEGTEGNQQQTRMVHIIDQRGQRAVVNAVSGDMFKHILVEHLTPLLEAAGEPLSAGAKILDADRINTSTDFINFSKEAGESEIMTKMLTECSVTDMAGTLVTRGRAVGRKSVVEFGWVVGLPTDGSGKALTATEQYFHVKYAPEGREEATGGDTVAGKQAIFHRPASSGIYALICNLDLYRIGRNDITRQYVVAKINREKRARVLIEALASTLLKPIGAQRNTQNPHLVSCEGAVAFSSSSLPAPTVSPLNDNYKTQLMEIAKVLNGITPDSIQVHEFTTFAKGVEILVDISKSLTLPEV